MSLLQAQNVHYIYQSKYQTVHAIKGIHFAFEGGRFYAIVGKSGCGKTTLLSLLAGLDLPTEGQILYDGKSTAERNRDHYRLRAVSLVCQNYNLFPLLTVEENVTYPMLLRGVKPEQAGKTVREKLTAVGLDSSYYKRGVRSPAANSSAWPSPGRWSPTRRSSLRTSRPATWIRRTVSSSSPCSSGWPTRRATASSLSPTTLPSRIWPTRSCA